MVFEKYHGLGNDYLVYDPARNPGAPQLTPKRVRMICDRNFGLGSDGILLGPLPPDSVGEATPAAYGRHRGAADSNAADMRSSESQAAADMGGFESQAAADMGGSERQAAARRAGEWGVRIFNPDGGEAEKSGNGVRIFARYLRDFGYASGSPFRLSTLGGDVGVEYVDAGAASGLIRVDMGRATFSSDEIPVAGARREVVGESMRFSGQDVAATCVSVGNPHCVVLCPPGERPTREMAERLGPVIERAPAFPNRINVQFMRIVDDGAIEIEIYERGAGYTLASGSSSCAAACAARRLGLVCQSVEVRMPGGALRIDISDGFEARMTGTVSRVCAIELADEFISELRSAE